jgi:hypothetical protein
VLLVFVVLLLREVRSTSAPAVKGGDGPSTTKDDSPTQSSDTPRPSMTGTVVSERDGAKPKTSPNSFAPSPGGTNGGGGAVADTAEPPSSDVDDPNHPVWAKQNGEEPSAWRVRVRIGQLALERGNYKGALKQVNPIITEDPTFTDAFKVAIPALCATGDLTTAQQYLGRLPQEADRTEVIAACSNLGAKLTP